MSSKDFLVVTPGLSYLYTSQRLTPAQLAKAREHLGEDVFVVAPYTQKLQRSLKAKYKEEHKAYLSQYR